MRSLVRLAVGAILVLGLSQRASAQNSLGAFGGFPSGVETGEPAPYDPQAQGYVVQRYGYPFTYTYTSRPIYGQAGVWPRRTYYSSGYAGYTYPRADSYSYGSPTYVYSYPTTTYAAPYFTPTYGYWRPGLFGGWWRRW